LGRKKKRTRNQRCRIVAAIHEDATPADEPSKNMDSSELSAGATELAGNRIHRAGPGGFAERTEYFKAPAGNSYRWGNGNIPSVSFRG